MQFLRYLAVALVVAAPLALRADEKTENPELEPIGKPLDLNEGSINRRLLQVVRFSPDGKQLAVGTGDGRSDGLGTLLQWEVETGNRLRTIEIRDEGRPIGRVDSLAFSRDGKTIAAVTYYWDRVFCNRFVLLDAVKGGEIGEPTAFGDGYCKTVFSPDGKTFLTVGHCKTRLWENASGKEKPDFALKTTAQVHNAIFSPDGRNILTGDDRNEHTCQLWDVEKGEAVGKPMAEQGKALAYSPDGKFFVTGGKKGLSVWEAAGGKIVSTLTLKILGRAPVVRISSDNKNLLVASYGRIELWDLAGPKRVVQIPAPEVYDISSDCTKVAGGKIEGNLVRLWKMPDEVAKRFGQKADK